MQKNEVKKTIEWTINQAICPEFYDAVRKYSEVTGKETTGKNYRRDMLDFIGTTFGRKSTIKKSLKSYGENRGFVLCLRSHASQIAAETDIVFTRKGLEEIELEKIDPKAGVYGRIVVFLNDGGRHPTPCSIGGDINFHCCDVGSSDWHYENDGLFIPDEDQEEARENNTFYDFFTGEVETCE